MPDDDASRPLPTADVDRLIDAAALKTTADDVLALAEALDADLDDSHSVAELQATARVQQDLRSRAGRLVVAQIRQLAGEAAVSAAHLNDAIAYARSAIAATKDLGRRLRQAGEVVGFLGVVLGGGGGAAIVAAAVKLREALDA